VTRPKNVFAGPYVDRSAHLRKDRAWLESAIADRGALVVPVWRGKHLIEQTPGRFTAGLLRRDSLGSVELESAEPIYLGQFRAHSCFAIEIGSESPPKPTPAADYRDLRLLGGALPADEAGLLAYARGMVLWRARHRFCGTCGAPTRGESAGHVMVCTNGDCGAQHFPRVDPAIIVLVADGTDERALLGRQASWPPGRYSTIAGFVEPGESLEDAVAREVLEETGTTVKDVRYHSSQPWPFPSSLMLGFEARADGQQQPRPDDELEDVRWFSRADIASGQPALPTPTSISFRLIEDWYARGASRALRDEPGARLWDTARR
jgi:NAD+ diphosphatase